MSFGENKHSVRMFNLALFLTFILIVELMAQVITKNGSQIDCKAIPPDFRCSNNELTMACNFTELCDYHWSNTTRPHTKVTVLFSSFCYHSQKFITHILYPDIYDTLRDHIDIELIPFGNANRTEAGFFFANNLNR